MTAVAAEDRDRVGPYRVIRAIGAGGSARIDLARIDRAYGFQRHVVLKRPLEHLRGDAQVAASLRREARIGGQLRHPNLVAILDAGVHDGYDYLVLEYVHGAALRSVMQGDAPGQVRDLPLGVALAIVCDAARGMHEAHELTDDRGSPLGLVHRDVSPGNILLGLDGTVKLADFGIAKETRVSTLSGSMHGTVTYMAPEQCQGHAFDRRADVFSLGVILYELVTGTRLFWADNDVASLHRVLSGAVPPPRSVKPQIAAALEDILMTAVAHAPERRFATALDLAGAVERYAATAGEVLGARWIARSVEAIVGPRPVPWIAAAAGDPDAAADDAGDRAGAPPRGPGPEATPPGGSLVALIAASGADEPVEPAFGDGSVDEAIPDAAASSGADPGGAGPAAAPVAARLATPTDIVHPEAAVPAAPPRRRRRAVIGAIVATGVAGAVAIAALRPPRGAEAPTGAPASAGSTAVSTETHAAPPRATPAVPTEANAVSGSTAPPADVPPTSTVPAVPDRADRHVPPAAAVPSRPGEHAAPGKRRRSASKPPREPALPAVTGAGTAAAPAPAQPPQATGAGSAAPPASPPAKVEWKPTLLLPTDGSNGTPRR